MVRDILYSSLSVLYVQVAIEFENVYYLLLEDKYVVMVWLKSC